MADEYIEGIHKENFELIKKFQLKEGVTHAGVTIKFIHPLYGWIISDDYNAPQEVSKWLLYVGARTL